MEIIEGTIWLNKRTLEEVEVTKLYKGTVIFKSLKTGKHNNYNPAYFRSIYSPKDV